MSLIGNFLCSSLSIQGGAKGEGGHKDHCFPLEDETGETISFERTLNKIFIKDVESVEGLEQKVETLGISAAEPSLEYSEIQSHPFFERILKEEISSKEFIIQEQSISAVDPSFTPNAFSEISGIVLEPQQPPIIDEDVVEIEGNFKIEKNIVSEPSLLETLKDSETLEFFKKDIYPEQEKIQEIIKTPFFKQEEPQATLPNNPSNFEAPIMDSNNETIHMQQLSTDKEIEEKKGTEAVLVPILQDKNFTTDDKEEEAEEREAPDSMLYMMPFVDPFLQETQFTPLLPDYFLSELNFTAYAEESSLYSADWAVQESEEDMESQGQDLKQQIETLSLPKNAEQSPKLAQHLLNDSLYEPQQTQHSRLEIMNDLKEQSLVRALSERGEESTTIQRSLHTLDVDGEAKIALSKLKPGEEVKVIIPLQEQTEALLTKKKVEEQQSAPEIQKGQAEQLSNLISSSQISQGVGQRMENFRRVVIQKIQQHIERIAPKQLNGLQICLQPSHLGKLRILIQKDKEQLSAVFIVENDTVKDFVKKSLPILQKALLSKGFDTKAIEVESKPKNLENMSTDLGNGQERKNFSSQEEQAAARSWRSSFKLNRLEEPQVSDSPGILSHREQEPLKLEVDSRKGVNFTV